MMMNLFSSFDPQSLISLHLNWIIAPTSLLLMPNKFWLNSNYKMKILNLTKMNLTKEMKPILTYNHLNKGIMIIPMSIMFMVLTQNLASLFP